MSERTSPNKLPAIKVPDHICKLFENSNLPSVATLPTLPLKNRLDAGANATLAGWAFEIYAGIAFMGAKEEAGTGAYMAAIAERGLAHRTVTQRVNRARLAMRVGKSDWHMFANLDPSKADLIVNWSDEEIAEFFGGGTVRGITYEDARAESFRDLQYRLRESKSEVSEIQRLAKQLARRNEELDEIERKAAERAERFRDRYPESVERARITGTAHGVACTTSLDQVERLVLNLVEGLDLAQDDGERRAQLRAGVAPLYVTLRGVMARAQQVLETLEANLARFIPETGGALLEADELRAAQDALKVMQVEIPGPAPRGAKTGRGRRTR